MNELTYVYENEDEILFDEDRIIDALKNQPAEFTNDFEIESESDFDTVAAIRRIKAIEIF